MTREQFVKEVQKLEKDFIEAIREDILKVLSAEYDIEINVLTPFNYYRDAAISFQIVDKEKSNKMFGQYLQIRYNAGNRREWPYVINYNNIEFEPLGGMGIFSPTKNSDRVQGIKLQMYLLDNYIEIFKAYESYVISFLNDNIEMLEEN